jgi:sugar phosphate isomerase/epimerase
MTQLAVNELTTYRWSLEEDVQQYKAAGISAIGVWRHKLSDCGEEKGAELIREAALRVSSLSWAGGFTGSDGRSHRESVEDAIEAVRLAAELDAGCLILHTGSRAGHTHNHARRLVKSALTEVGRVAAEAGVALALEPMHPGCAGDWTFITSLEQSLELISDIDLPALRIVFDTYHLCQDDCLPLSPATVDKIALVQLGDARRPPDGEQNRCRLGTGKIPLADVVGRLTSAGYSGDWEIELLGEDVETADYSDLLSHAKQAARAWFGGARKIA